MTAPAGYWKFKVLVNTGMDPLHLAADVALKIAYPNPAGAITCIPVHSATNCWARLRLLDVLGREVRFLFQGELPIGRSHYFFRAGDLLPGVYLIELTTFDSVETQKIMVK